MSRVSILPRRGSGATLGRRSSAPISAPSLRGFLHCRGDGLIWAGADVRLLRNRSGEPEGRGRRDLPPARRALDGPNGAQSPRCGGRLLARKAVPPRGPRPAVHEGVREVLTRAGTRVVRLPARSPNLNAFAERFVLSVRSECLDRIIPLGDWHLRHAVSEYLKHYHQERNHQGLGNVLIDSSLAANDNCRVRRRQRLGGLLSYYHREAA